MTSYYGIADVSTPWNAYQPSADKGADWKVGQREKLKTGQPVLVVSWYNEFQDRRDPNNFFSSSLLGGVSSVNPGIARHYDPLPAWGTKAVQFDAQGRLVLFQAFEIPYPFCHVSQRLAQPSMSLRSGIWVSSGPVWTVRRSPSPT